MVTHTRNSCSTFIHPSAHTHIVNTHPEQWAAIYAATPGEQLGVRCLTQGHLSGVEGGESAVHSLPNFRLCVRLSTIRPQLPHPSVVTGTLYCKKAPSFGWNVKSRSWLSVVIKNPRMSFEKNRDVTPASSPNFSIGLWPSWPPNHPHTLIGFITLFPLQQWAGVWWTFWHNMAAIALSRWILHTGGGRGDSPPPSM